jgi:hypothetical protein
MLRSHHCTKSLIDKLFSPGSILGSRLVTRSIMREPTSIPGDIGVFQDQSVLRGG